MSYTIEYSAEVYKEPAEWKQSSENSYVVIVTQGDNNVYEADNSRRARETDIVAYGWNYSIIGTVCNRAGACEGGGLVINGKSITPEEYIKRYRTKIKNAPLITEFFKQGKIARFRITVDPESRYDTERVAKYKEFIRKESNHYSPEEKELWVNNPITGQETWNVFKELWGLARSRSVALVNWSD